MLYSPLIMRIAIVSDIHANQAALEAVLADAAKVDGIWCPGDIVGYGPSPNECVELLRARDAKCVAGNHDWAAIGKLSTEHFNPDATVAANWTSQALLPESRGYLESLPEVLRPPEFPDFTIVHGSLLHHIWQYLVSTREADVTFALLESRYCLVGHTHVPAVFLSENPEEPSRGFAAPYDRSIKLGADRMIVNPGSVGQPRDGNPTSSYLILDTEAKEITYRRVAYDIARTQRLMQLHNLPPRLSERLSYGW